MQSSLVVASDPQLWVRFRLQLGLQHCFGSHNLLTHGAMIVIWLVSNEGVLSFSLLGHGVFSPVFGLFQYDGSGLAGSLCRSVSVLRVSFNLMGQGLMGMV